MPLRFIVFLLVPILVFAAGTLAIAAPPSPSPSPSSAASAERPEQAHDGGILNGTITGIDYVRGIMSLRADKRGNIDVYILPSTSIQGKGDGYFTISDLKKGAAVGVYSSVVGTRTNAQIIRLR